VVGAVVAGVVRGADGVVDLAGAAGAACRAGLRRRASTVTGGSGLLPGVAVGGVGVVSGAGVSDAGGVVVSGVSVGVDGVCDHATPVKQSANSAELLKSSKRLLLRIDMTIPSILHGKHPLAPTIDALRRSGAAWASAQRSLTRGAADTGRSMSGEGRRARAERRGIMRFGQIKFDRDCE
jgi:hypothetical protein